MQESKIHSSSPFLLLGLACLSTPALASSVAINQSLIFPSAAQGDPGATVSANSSGAQLTETTAIGSTSYSISLPASITLSSGGSSITVNTFTSSPSGSGTTNGSSTQVFYVGASYGALSGTQAPGTYTGTANITTTSSFILDSPRTVTTGVTVKLIVISTLAASVVSNLSFGTAAPSDPPKTVLPSDTQAASFNISGQPNQAFTVSLPTDGTVIMGNGGGDNIAVDGFASTPTGSGMLSAGGTSTLLVGATRAAIKSNQQTGSYSGGFVVTVHY